MYPVSAAYKNAITKDIRDVKITGTITLKDNTFINITDKDILQGSLYITEQCVSGEDIEVGNVYAAEMGLTLTTPLDNPYRLDGARILLNYGIDVSEDGSDLWEYVPLGYFYVTDIARKLNNVTLTAFDGMILFDVDVGDPGSRSPRNFIVHACNRAGIALGTSIAVIDALPNAGVLLAAPDVSKIKTARDLLMWACQITGSFARMNRQGQLEIVPIAAKERVKAIEKKERFSSDVSDFAVRITKVSMQVGETEYSRGFDGMTMILEENPLMVGLTEAQIKSILDNILAQITQVIYVPFKSDFMGDPALQPGDFIDIRDAGILESETYFLSAAAPLEVHVDIVRSIITHSTWRYRGPHLIRGAGKSGIVRGVQNQQIKAISSIIAVARAAQDIALSANQSTQLIKDAIGGNVLIRQGPNFETNEILIMDHPDPAQAVKIWRWNMGGLAYSDNCIGADNPDREYPGLALTMDGAINASFIKTGILDAGVVKIGPQTTFAEGYDPTQIEGFDPGYVTADSEGIKVYDASNALRVLLGSWLDSAVRKYGIKIVDGEIYSTLISTKKPGAAGAYAEISPTGTITIYDITGKVGLMLSGLSGQGAVDWHFEGTKYAGSFINAGTNKDLTIWTVRNESGIILRPWNDRTGIDIGSGGGNEVDLKGDYINLNTPYAYVSGDMWVSGSLYKGTNHYVEPTKNYGIRLLNAVEGPEMTYLDRGRVRLENGECVVYLDPIFLETIEPDTDLTPWTFQVEVYGEGEDIRVVEWGETYFKVKECNGGKSNRLFGWWFYATRINHAGIRLMELVKGVN